MKKNNFMCKILIYFSIVIFLFGCDRKIYSGELQGLKIGMSKNDVVIALLSRGVSDVVPVVDKLIGVDKNSLSLMPELSNSDEICVDDNSGFVLQISFIKEKPTIVYSSAHVDLITLKLDKLKTKEEAILKIEDIIKSHENISVFNCVLDYKLINLKTPQLRDIEGMQYYNSWFYYIPNSYSTATLRFSDGKLFAIEYNWRPFETP